jgi:predicted alpha/beta superfamily hydrolase
MKTLYLSLLLFFTAQNLSAQLPQPASGSVHRLANFASKHVSARNVDIWLPAGYSKNKKYAVLYMHDGSMLFDSTHTWNKTEWGVDETMTKLRIEGLINDVIVVGIWNGGATRHSDYFPQKAYAFLTQPEKIQLRRSCKGQAVRRRRFCRSQMRI